MISDKKGERTFDPEERINEIAAMIKQGQSFESLAKEHSDDKSSAVKGGILNAFTKGQLRSPEFEEAAYKLKKPGDISKPVKTSFGWHIIRMEEVLPEETFEDLRQMLEKRVSQGDRAKLVTYTVNKKIKDKYGFKLGEDYAAYFNNYVKDTVLARKWEMEPIPSAEDKTIFTIGNKKVKFSDFAKYIEERQKTSRPYQSKDLLITNFYEEFETNQLKDYFKIQLEKQNEDYKWKQRLDADIFSATSQLTAQRVQKMLEDGKSGEEIKQELNPEGIVNVILSQGAFEVGQSELPANLEIKKGISKIYTSNDSFIVVNVKEILPPGIKTLEEVKGKVISSYQNELETEWMNSLRSKYEVEVNARTLRRVKRTLK